MFQWGWLSQLFGVTPAHTLSFLPIIMLAVIFGLSDDDEIFLVARIKEQLGKTGDGVAAVENGLGASVRVFTADPIVKAIGFSLAVGVLVDAFVVRLMLVPAVMAIIGDKLWYHPRWFGRVVPDLDIEGEKLERELARR